MGIWIITPEDVSPTLGGGYVLDEERKKEEVFYAASLRIPTGEISKFYSFLVIDLTYYRHVTNS